MKYLLLKSADRLMQMIQVWARDHRDQLNLVADYRSSLEVRLAIQSPGSALDIDSAPGCTLSIRENALIVACSQACADIERKVTALLQKQKFIGAGIPLEEIVPFRRKNIRHDHELGRQVSDEAKAKRRERREECASVRPESKFAAVIEAALSAEEEAGAWLILSERAKETARTSRYVDPDYVHQALMDLAHAAKHNADHKGLGMSWADFLGQLRSHDFVPNTSPNTIQRYYNEYHISHEGEDLCIAAHIRQGNGSAQDCLRIYVVQPRKPGDPIIIGQIGAHLPTDGRAH
jgi:hypothetical protein